MNDQNNNIGNWIDIIALIVGIQNLAENRQQSAYNDVQKANNSQAEYLLSEINRRFDEQNEILMKNNIVQKRGKWIPSEIPCEMYVCSECGGSCWYYDVHKTVSKSAYCPNCGAKMED